jgi:alpha-2-macroglobulin
VVLDKGEVTTDADGRATWQVTLPQAAGDYRYRAVLNARGRRLGDTAYIWVPGAQAMQQTDGYDRYLELIADQRSYTPGDTARLLVRGDEVTGAVLVTKEGQHVSWHQVLRPSAGAAIEVPITGADIGDTWVNIAFLRDDRLFRAERRIVVPATSQQVQLAIAADAAVSRPGRPATFTVQATDHAGQPVRAQVSLAVIDEAVYGVKADRTPDPLRFFHRREYSSVGTQFSRTYSFVGYSGTEALTLARARRRPHGLADFKGERAQPQVRKEFPDAIHWTANLVTDAQGRARVEVRYPDSLTTWRLTARAVTADTRVGSAVSRTTTTKDLIVRAITPRFLSQGDEMIVPVVTHNYLPAPQQVTVSAGAANLSRPDDAAEEAAERTVTVPSGGEQRIDYRFRADRVGPASVIARAVAATDGDAVEITLPVLPFGLRAEVSAAGSLRGAGSHQATLEVPSTANPAARTIRVSLAPSLAGSLLGALDFLTSFPYGCTEQILSAFVPTLVVARTVNELGLRPTERLQLVDRQVTAGLRRLADMQHADGGWGWWKADENHPFMTAYAVYGLLEARAHGYRVDEWRLRQGVASLARQYAQYPRAVPELKAYMTYVLLRADAALERALDDGPFAAAAAVDELWAARGRMSPYGRALLLQVLDLRRDARGDELSRALLDEAVQQGMLAHWPSANDPLLDDWMDTSVEATATAVRALAARQPDHPVLEAAVRYLMASRTGTYWISTKQTAMAIYGLTDYMRARKETGAPMTVAVSVNGGAAETVTFSPESLTAPDPLTVTAPAREGGNEVTLRTEGAGVVYWSAAAEYFDQQTPIERTGSRHLALVRRYFSLTPVQVGGRTRYRETPFAGTARPGDVLLVRLSAAGSTDWRYLMIEDPLPAGTEAIAEADLYPLESETRSDWWWLGRRELRDDRAVFFRDRLPGGRLDLWYLLKVTTPGRFTAMPARVTPMYAPNVSASSEVQRVHVPANGEGVTP